MRKVLSLAVAAAIFLLCALPASSAPQPAYPAMNIRLSHNQPVDSPEDVGAQKFKELVEERSGGRITVEVFPQMQLGSMREQTEMVQMGTIEVSIQPTAVLMPFVEELQLIDFPFLWPSREDLYRVMDGQIGQRFYAFGEKRGFKMLGLWSGGFKQFTTKGKQINSPEDFKGMKMRVMPSPLLLEQYQAWGANPVPIEYAELYNALQQNIVDGEENPLQSIAMNRFYEVQDYLTLSGHGFFGYLFFVGQEWFNRLPDNVKALITECEREARELERETQAKNEAGYLEQIRQSKIVINELTPEGRKAFADVSRPLHSKFANTSEMASLLEAVYEATGQN
ncbi:MAG: TRAP transporter substrate-binding protein [Fretibacterium sp.]|nr:TRAP transporter substrate-binding protein [Fretibacterium sp.]